MAIRIENVKKTFPGAQDFVALNGVSLDIKTGELIALLGPSGSGKTTLLRIIAGLEFADSGEIFMGDEDASLTPAPRRRVGFVFQHYALFKHMSVFENVAFGLRVKKGLAKPGEDLIRSKVMKLLDLVHLAGFHDRYPSQLSGGQRQRVALARALAVDPKMLLLDEPFGALDAKVRKELRRWLRRLHENLHITTIFVTHDQEEAMELADRVVVMNQGRIEQAGAPEDVYHNPANAFVYDFLGNYNSFEGYRRADGTAGLVRIDGDIPADSERVRLFARPHDTDLSIKPQDSDCIAARIIHVNLAGPLVCIEMEDEWGTLLQAALPRERYAALSLARGQIVYARPTEFRAF